MTSFIYYSLQLLPFVLIAAIIIGSFIRFVEIEVAYRKK